MVGKRTTTEIYIRDEGQQQEVRMEGNSSNENTTKNRTELPTYERAMRMQPPPPTYKQSTTRLCYNNQPYITDNEFTFCHQCHFNRYNNHYQHEYTSDTDSIYMSTMSGKLRLCAASWVSTIREAKLVFFAFFILVTIIVLGVIVPFVRFPPVAANM